MNSNHKENFEFFLVHILQDTFWQQIGGCPAIIFHQSKKWNFWPCSSKPTPTRKHWMPLHAFYTPIFSYIHALFIALRPTIKPNFCIRYFSAFSKTLSKKYNTCTANRNNCFPFPHIIKVAAFYLNNKDEVIFNRHR